MTTCKAGGFLSYIKAYLYDNPLTGDPYDLIAKVSSERSLTIGDISQSAATRGGAGITAASMEHAVRLWLKEMAYRLCDGFAVNAEWFTAAPHIRGVFNSPAETFNPDRHTLLFTFNQGALLRREIAVTEVQVLGVADTALAITQVTDVKTASVNDLLTPGRNLRISGSRLKIAGDNPANGVAFINAATGERLPVDRADIVTNNPSELIILIPDLAPGVWNVEVTTQYSANKRQHLIEPRTARFERKLTVM